MKLNITLILDTEKDNAARKILSWLNEIIIESEPMLEPYAKGGTKAVFSTKVTAVNWPDAILEALILAQSFGRSWVILGSVDENLDLICNEFSVTGITWAQFSMVRT